MTEKGLVHIYTGNGKGKTTAAIGLACRAAGAGKRVLIAQFLKGRDTGELASLKILGIKMLRTDVKKFVPYMTEEERTECKAGQESCFRAICGLLADYDLVVLDEILGAISMKMVGLEDVVNLIQDKPDSVELVLTGRGAPNELIALADYVSDIQCVKHPYEKGIQARRGIEF